MNLPIYGVVSDLILISVQRQKHLNEYTTNETDTMKGMSRIPLDLARIKEEDLLPHTQEEEEKQAQSRKQPASMSSEAGGDGLMQNLRHRERAYEIKKGEGVIGEDFDAIMDDNILNNKTREKSHSLYYMNQEDQNVQLEDF